ncbi:hypothetical protein M120_3670 [Bacteroides fragilis str. 3783N1-8]|nr:hypothetical protein M120_3670 [Bacteroides fragilis str. 3783N1-8]
MKTVHKYRILFSDSFKICCKVTGNRIVGQSPFLGILSEKRFVTDGFSFG